MVEIRAAIYELLQEEHPMTVRQVFYQLVSRGVIAKSEGEYKRTVVRLLTAMRLDGDLPFGWLADNTRWQRKPDTYGGLSEMLEEQTRFYRRAIWREQPDLVEVWLEKDALAGVLFDETAEWDVPLMVTRGYPSLSFVHSAAEAIAAAEKRTFIYYLGDHDPSGKDIPRHVEERLRELSHWDDIVFKVVAVTEDQIEEWSLPTRPTKTTDTRARSFKGESVEVDAIPPSGLRAIVHDCIVAHIDSHLYERTMQIEKQERHTLEGLVASLAGKGTDGPGDRDQRRRGRKKK